MTRRLSVIRVIGELSYPCNMDKGTVLQFLRIVAVEMTSQVFHIDMKKFSYVLMQKNNSAHRMVECNTFLIPTGTSSLISSFLS